MSYQVHDQYVDLASGMHVYEIRDGKTSEIVQFALRHHSCPSCGFLYHKTELDQLDPKAMVAALIEEREASKAAFLDYAKKHGVQVR